MIKLKKALISLFIILICIFTVLNFDVAYANPGWLTGWTYRKSHVINYAAGAGTNYQVKVTVHYGAGTDSGADVYLNSHSRTDFGDVRFTDNDQTTLLDYWMESKTDSNNAVFWVEVADDLSTVNQTVYIYYGKSDATTTSNGFNTFNLFDDFNRANNSAVGNGWTEDEDAGVGALSIDTNTLKIIQYQNYFCHIEKAGPAISTLVLQGKLKIGSNAGVSWMPAIFIYWGTYNWCCVGIQQNTVQVAYNKDGTVSGSGGGTLSTNTWYYIRIRVTSDTVYFDYSTDGETWNAVPNAASTSRPSSWDGNPALILGGKGYSQNAGAYSNSDLDNNYSSSGASGTHYIDDILCRKYVSPEPSHGSWGSEETAGNFSFPFSEMISPSATLSQLQEHVSTLTEIIIFFALIAGNFLVLGIL